MQRRPRWGNCEWRWRPRLIGTAIFGLPSFEAHEIVETLPWLFAPCSWDWSAVPWPSNFGEAIEWFGSGLRCSTQVALTL